MTFIRQLELIERIDQLIRFKATGPAPKLATKLGVSRTKLYRILSIMKELNAPVEYDDAIQSFIYNKEVGLKFGFYPKGLKPHTIQSVA